MALMQVNAGDIVAIPAMRMGEHGFVLSRVIVPISIRTIEVFRGFYTNFSISQKEIASLDLSAKDRLFSPIHASFDFYKGVGKIKWPILLRDSSYNAEEKSQYSKIEFMGPPDMYNDSGVFYRGGVECFEAPGVRRELEDPMIYSNTQLMFRINLHMSGLMTVGEAMTVKKEHALIEKYGMDWLVEGTNEWAEIGDAIAIKFKSASKLGNVRTTL